LKLRRFISDQRPPRAVAIAGAGRFCPVFTGC
jgi:hypothetical protein